MKWTCGQDQKLDKAQAQADLAKAELEPFATVRAPPFDGIIDRLQCQQGSLILEGDILTTLSDNSVMWAYFNVPEARYLEYMQDPHKAELKIELRLANGEKFNPVGKLGARSRPISTAKPVTFPSVPISSQPLAAACCAMVKSGIVADQPSAE